MSIYRSLYLISLALCAPLWSVGCESEGCTVNSDCGTDALCRDTVCKPKCQTYITCADGEACVDGACETPTADYCSHVVPAQTPPEMGPYAPCAPTEMGVGMGGEMGEEMGEEMGGEISSVASDAVAGMSEAGMSVAGMNVAGMSVAGMSGAGETAGEISAGETAGEISAGETAGETAGESSAGESSAGEIEVIGGQTE